MFIAYENVCGLNFCLDGLFFRTAEDAIQEIINSEVCNMELNERRLSGCNYAREMWTVEETSEYGNKLTLVIFREPGRVRLYDKTNRKFIIEYYDRDVTIKSL